MSECPATRHYHLEITDEELAKLWACLPYEIAAQDPVVCDQPCECGPNEILEYLNGC